MARKVKELQNIGIIGLGRFGMSLAQELSKNENRVICIDKDEKKVKKALEYCSFAYVTDDLSLKNLEELGLKTCDIVVICIAEEMDVSILTTLNVVSLGVKKVYAKAASEEHGQILAKLGAEVLFPEKDSAFRLLKRIYSKNILDYISLNDTIDITEVKLPKKYIGKEVKNTDIRRKFGLNIIAIKQGSIIITAIDPNYEFIADDTIFVIGPRKNIIDFEEQK